MKAKRKLTDINFEKEGSAVALVGKHQGGPANGVTTLILKATDDISEEATKKAMSSFVEGEQPKKESNEEQMQEEIQKAVDAAEAVLKAKHKEELGAKEVELQKALEEIEQYKQEKKEAVAKARKEAIAAVEKDAAEAESLFKSLESLADEAFDVVLKSLKKQKDKLEESDLFVEKGANSQPAADKQEDKTAALLKAKYAK